jgi:DNA-binding LacI/PurR family transcriptional regulator
MERQAVTRIQDVARDAGVSVSTVSNVLNGRADRMTRETLGRVEAAIARLGFRPSQAARSLKTGQMPIIGLLVPSIANPMYGSIAREVEQVAQEQHNYRVLLGSTYRSTEKEASFIDDLLSHGVRSVIVISSLTDEGHIEAVLKRGLVVVSYDRRADADAASRIDHVSVDNFKAGQIAARHLIEHGHRRLAFATAAGVTMSRRDKIGGFLDGAAGVADTEVLEGRVGSAYGDSEMVEVGRALAAKIARVAQGKRPTGLVAVNDMLAIGLIAGLREHGLRVPDDISVLGMDDMFLAPLVSPALSSVGMPLADMARTMVERVITRLADPQIPTAEFLFEPRLAQRLSVAAPPP